ncbi:hypothetical protein SELMODRAFT_77235 [Selaginella moellendorffii]|uniref:Protein root UVB sensitive/RUS domain-containing protein n=1 Tax=Selaginella moellendorffii TaxID=88036 RepID=D8QS01_SELML|nr:protein root UVB sensitive 2, chloroplastic [Selaginella moellendorffii]EFJ36852.1 hypothetical protein SELMODRAFT_77235 [Selaginella moellendorffii]|eukprot:XP_002961592.1 protein root UVB sensitive 2, chloroplastic [Selaginella moellendorffii]
MGELWRERSENARREYVSKGDGTLQARLLDDNRPLKHKLVDGFLDQFFPVGYPQSVGEGYLTYSQFRALQHFSSAILSVFSTQSLVFAAGLRPTPAQATVISWVLKDGMQHIGKLVGSRMGARMDSEPKRWRIFADVLYDAGTALEIISPACPQYFLGVAGLANLAKGVAMVTARATRLPLYTAFAKEGNLSDLYAKGEAMSTLANVAGLGVGIRLASSACTSLQGKLLVAPLLSVIHLYSVMEEMRAVPLDTLNAQRTAMLVADYLELGRVPSPAEIRYRERLILPVKPNVHAGSVRIANDILQIPSGKIRELKHRFQSERFLLDFHETSTEMVLHHSASGEDVVRGWLLAACSSKEASLSDAYSRVDKMLPEFLSQLKSRGWQTQLFLHGSAARAFW